MLAACNCTIFCLHQQAGSVPGSQQARTVRGPVPRCRACQRAGTAAAGRAGTTVPRVAREQHGKQARGDGLPTRPSSCMTGCTQAGIMPRSSPHTCRAGGQGRSVRAALRSALLVAGDTASHGHPPQGQGSRAEWRGCSGAAFLGGRTAGWRWGAASSQPVQARFLSRQRRRSVSRPVGQSASRQAGSAGSAGGQGCRLRTSMSVAPSSAGSVRWLCRRHSESWRWWK